jgi:hypothetical protein
MSADETRAALPPLPPEVGARRRGRPRRPALQVAQILAWADAHRLRTGDWPTAHSGAVAAAPGETWKAVHAALSEGSRGLPGRDTLAGLLRRWRGASADIARGAAAAARRQQALRLRAQGLTQAQIGRGLGVTRQAVSGLLRRAGEGREVGPD